MKSSRSGSTGSWPARPSRGRRSSTRPPSSRREQDAFKQQWGPVFDLGFLSLAGLLAIGGPVLLYLWWYRKGRDAPVGLIADYLPEPPSDLPAGMVGTLIDERADLQDVIATLLDLAKRGVLEIEEIARAGLPGHRHQVRFHLPAEEARMSPCVRMSSSSSRSSSGARTKFSCRT